MDFSDLHRNLFGEDADENEPLQDQMQTNEAKEVEKPKSEHKSEKPPFQRSYSEDLTSFLSSPAFSESITNMAKESKEDSAVLGLQRSNSSNQGAFSSGTGQNAFGFSRYSDKKEASGNLTTFLKSGPGNRSFNNPSTGNSTASKPIGRMTRTNSQFSMLAQFGPQSTWKKLLQSESKLKVHNTSQKSMDAAMESKEIEDKLLSFIAKDTKSPPNCVHEKTVIHQLAELGFDTKDPSTLKSLSDIKGASTNAPPGTISYEQLKQLPPSSPIIKALCETVEMTYWKEFTEDVVRFFNEVEPNSDGETADYIPSLSEADPEKFAISICSVDGQQFSFGDTDIFFSIQSCVKPIIYGLACEEIGVSEVHKWVGTEASGLSFNEISLNADDRPHNPMINSGAIQCAGLVKRHLQAAPRFRYLLSEMEGLAGGHKIGFSQDTYLGEFETAWRNNAIIHFMKAANAFPPYSKSEEILDMYLQGCSLEVNTQIMAVIAGSLANRGVCPLTQKNCLSPWVVKSTLSLLFSCGMYDYSGEWSVEVGLPAKSGVAGLIFVVVPNVMGIAVFSPRLDIRGNSVRGIEICKRIMSKYQFGPFDQLLQRTTGLTMNENAKRKNRRAKFLMYLFAEKIGIYYSAFCTLCGPDGTTIIQDIEFKLKSCGINPKCPRAATLLAQITNNGTRKRIHFRDLFVSQRDEDNLVMKCLRGTCCFPSLEEFTTELKTVFHQTEPDSEGTIPDALLQELRRVDPKLFGVSICSVDGQCFDIGDCAVDFPFLSCVQPFIYALACQDLGLAEVHKFVGKEPTSKNPNGFAYGRDGKPYNPFVDSGALAVASLLRPQWNATRRYQWIAQKLSDLSGGNRLTFSQPIFLEQKGGSHMLKAVAHSMRGSKLFPEGTKDPTYVYLECSSIEVNCKKLAVMAATLANGGRCPITDKKLLEPEVIKSLYSLLYSCGMKQFAGWWNFHVGIPATFGESGCMMVVIPNVMGIAIYSPRLNKWGISERGIRFCQLLTKKFRFGIFDQLVYGDREFNTPASSDKKHQEDEFLFFTLANECAAGHYDDVEAILLKHPHVVNHSDYDKRTPLHLACSEGHESVVKLLLQSGAKPDARDRWTHTPMDDLKSHNHTKLIPLLEEALLSQEAQNKKIKK